MEKSQKILILDGVNTLLSNGYFIKDDIPRYLAKHLDLNFNFWLLIMSPEEQEEWNKSNIPDWLKQNTFVMNTDLFNEMKKIKFDTESVFISNDKNIAKFYNIKIKIKTPKEFFNFESYKPLNIADVVLCFGFEIQEFIDFCSESNLIGVSNETYYNFKTSKADGIAIIVDEKISQSEDLYEYILNILNKLIEQKKYKIKHNNKIIGVTYKGLGLQNINLNILENKTLPILLV